MGYLQRSEGPQGTTYLASCATGWLGAIIAPILIAIGGGMTAVAITFLWPALTQLFGPGKGGVGGWMAWFSDQIVSVAMLPLGLIGLIFVLVGVVLLGLALLFTSVRRDGDDLVCGFGILGLRLAEREIPLRAIARLGLRETDRSSVGDKVYVNLDLVAHLHPDQVLPPVRGYGPLGRLLALLSQRDHRPLTSSELLCKLPDDETTRGLIGELARSWNLPWDPTPEQRRPLGAIREERQRLER